jgi:hypothetical protein
MRKHFEVNIIAELDSFLLFNQDRQRSSITLIWFPLQHINHPSAYFVNQFRSTIYYQIKTRKKNIYFLYLKYDFKLP